jgi:hypothetical protein
VRRDLVIGRGSEQWLAVLTPEGQKCLAQALRIEPPLGIDPDGVIAGRKARVMVTKLRRIIAASMSVPAIG